MKCKRYINIQNGGHIRSGSPQNYFNCNNNPNIEWIDAQFKTNLDPNILTFDID
jgi:hypothetical protein